MRSSSPRARCCKANDAAAESATDAAESPASQPRTRAAVRRVLIVDDDASIREACRWALEELGYAAVTANHGREALDVFAADSEFDLVILDLVMPA